jgi:hypothetical protein
MAKTQRTNLENDVIMSIASSLRSTRLKVGLTQEGMSELMGNAGRAAFHKLEQGINTISLVDYLILMYALREEVPDHPALSLAEHFGIPGICKKNAGRDRAQ